LFEVAFMPSGDMVISIPLERDCCSCCGSRNSSSCYRDRTGMENCVYHFYRWEHKI